MKKKELVLFKEERLLKEQLKRDNVERIKLMHEYRRLETMRKVTENEKRTDDLLRKKDELLNQHRCAAREAKIQKDKIMSILEQTRMGGGRSVKKMMAVLSGNDESGRKKGKAKQKKRASRGTATLGQINSEGDLVEIGDLGPPPVCRLKERFSVGLDSNFVDCI